MAIRCKNDTLMNKIGIRKVDKLTEVTFAVLQDADSCVKLNTKNYHAFEGNNATFNQYRVPEDMFSCLAEGCKNTGTLLVTGGAGATTSATFVIPSDSTEYVAGVVTYYLDLPVPDNYSVEVTISDLKDTNQTNADVYDSTVTAEHKGFYPMVVDLSQAPQAQKGNGWQPTENGVMIKIAVTPADAATVSSIGFSSIYIFDSSEDLEVNDVVKVGCIDELTGEIAIDPADTTCFGISYDETSIEIERTLTGKSVTENYWKLNPLMHKGKKSKGWYIHTEEREVVPTVVDGRNYGLIQLPDLQLEECAFTKAQISDNCDVTTASLNRVNTPVPMVINERQFIVMDGTTTNKYDAGKVLFHSDIVGQKVIISYPKEADVEHFIADETQINYRRVRMTVQQEQTDDVHQVYIFNNVLVTSFPMTINNEETSFEFTLSIQRDKNGVFFEEYRIIE